MKRLSTGFTLIELLVTIAVFTAVMGALVTSMQAGVRSWKNIRTHQTRQAEIQHAMDVITGDIMNMFVPERGVQPIVESPLEDGGDKVTFSALERTPIQRAGKGYVWNQLTYFVQKDRNEEYALMRESVSFVTKVPLGSEPTHAILLANIKKLTIDYGTGQDFAPEWKQAQCPAEIMVTLEQKKGRALCWTICIPAGMWSQK